MLAKDMRFLGQRLVRFYYSCHSTEPEHQHIYVCSLWLQVFWGQHDRCCTCSVFAWQVRNTAEQSTVFTTDGKQDWIPFWGKLTSPLNIPSYIATLRNSPHEKMVWCGALAHPWRHIRVLRGPSRAVFSNKRIFRINALLRMALW